jgi:membrane protein implicated in regulation of membrane protease activity
MKVGGIITLIGMVFGLIALAPLVSGQELPSWLWWLAMSAGVGLALVLIGLHRAATARRRQVAQARETVRTDEDGKERG